MPTRSVIIHQLNGSRLLTTYRKRSSITDVIQELRVTFLIYLLLFLVACTPAPDHQVIELQGSAMGTTYNVKVVDLPGAVSSDELQQKINEALERINNLMSTYQTDSELSRFNGDPTTNWVPVSMALAQVVDEARKTSEQSGGAFDVTVGPLVNLWGFGPGNKEKKLPTSEEIAITRQGVGFRKLQVRFDPPGLRKLLPELYVDLSAIAKGYGVDEVARLLDALEIANYLVEIGGEIHASGHSSRGTPWRVAVETPDSRRRSVYRIVELSGGGMATSGDYRNFYTHDGKRYSHTIDPVTARPVTHQLASVTVLMPDTMRADALATAMMALGPEAGFELAVSQGIAALFVVRQGDAYSDITTKRFKRYLQQERSDG